jgi:gliding motility-associated-like protein
LSDGAASITPTGGTGSYVVLWSNGQNTNTATNLLAGQTYCVTVTDGIGCGAQDCIVVSFVSNIAVTIANDSLDCSGDTNGSLVLDIQLGLAPYSYVWQNANNTQNGSGTVNTQNGNAVLNNLLPGNYFVTVSDAYGLVTAQASIFEPAPLMAFPTSTMASCFGACDGIANVNISGGTSPYQYFWPNAAITPTATDLCSGNYPVTVSDANGCTIVQSVFVNEPIELVVSIGSIDNVSCNGGSDGTALATLNGTAATFLWDNGESTAAALNLSAGVHAVSVTDINGCEAVGTALISEPEDPVVVLINLLTDASCFGGDDGSLLAVGSGGEAPYQYIWDNGVSNQISNGLIAGNYTVTVTDNNGCTAVASAMVNQPTAITASFIVKEVTCPEGENSGRITLDTAYGGAGSYYFSLDDLNFSLDTVFDNLPAGEYTVAVQDIEGCIQQFPVVVEAPESIMLVLDEEPIVIDLGEPVTLDPFYLNNNLIFNWTGLLSGDCSNCANVTTTPLKTTLYELMVTDTTTDCVASATQLVQVILKRDVFIPNAFSPNGDGSNDYFFVHAGPEVVSIKNFSIFNRWGAAVYSIQNSEPNDYRNGWDGRFKGKLAENGVYIYVVDMEFIDGERLQYEGDLTLMR